MDTQNASNKQSQIRWEQDGFPERLKTAKGHESTHGFAQRCGISESIFRKYLAGASVPGADKLVDIARVAGVSLLWLATGLGSPRDGGAEGSGTVNEALLEAIIESIEAGLQQIGGELSPAKKAKLVVAIYRIYQAGGDARKAPVLELVKLAV
jgi:transcriptional regulator with XRE-family HTH domain